MKLIRFLPVVAGLLLVLLMAGGSSAHASNEFTPVGESVKDRPIRAQRLGDPDARLKVLVVGSIHGDEPQGIRVVRRLRKYFPGGVKDADIWTIKTTNPDGIARGTRKNARGVDLNRNFPYRFDPTLDGGYNSGPRPASEPETRAVMKLARKVRFDLAIWYHQPWGRTLVPCNRDARWVRLYARYSGLRARKGCERGLPGTAIGWLHKRIGTVAMVAEFPGRKLRKAEVKRHARAVIRLTKKLR